MKLTKYDLFIREVKSGKLPSCELVKLAVARHEKDLKRKDIYFDRAAADAAIAYIETFAIDIIAKLIDDELQSVEKKLVLGNFQAFIVAMIFGWKITKTKKRRFTSSYDEMAKKTGKTTLIVAIALTFFGLAFKAEVYACATKREQARIAFETAQFIVKNTSHLQEAGVQALQHSIFNEQTYSFFKPLASNSKKQDGLRPFFVIVDELHEHPDSHLYNNMKSALVFQPDGHIAAITTAGFNKGSFCFELRDYAIKVLRGQIIDDSFFAIIFTMDEKDNLENPKLWIKSNPNLGVTVTIEKLISEFNTAKNLGGEPYNSFLTKNLNLWTDAAAVWIHDDVWWKKNHHGFKISDLKGKPCYGGLDCAKSIDLNAWVLYFPDVFEVNDKPISAFLPFFWIPEDYVKKNRDRIDYSRWVQQGYITPTSGNIADWKKIEFDILNSIQDYDFQGLSYDPAYAGNVAANLADEGLRCSPLRQGFLSLTNPTNELARLATGGLLEHFNNPVMRWMMGNVTIVKDAAGNIKPDKAKSSNKIDGVAALVDAIADHRNEDMKENKSAGMFVI